jgi:hypothetical protein
MFELTGPPRRVRLTEGLGGWLSKLRKVVCDEPESSQAMD